MGLRRVSFLLIAMLGFSIISESTWAQEINNNQLLSSPRRAVHSFVHWQQTGHQNFDRVVLPFKNVEGDKEDKVELAQQLLRVLDARGLLVEYDKIPDNPAYVDSLSGLNQYILFNQLPEVYVTKVEDDWVFSEATVEQIPTLYRATFSSLIEAILDQLPEWTETE